MRRRLLVGLALSSTALVLTACTKGEECDTCSKDSDCRSGLMCSQFNDGSKLCGTGTGATLCRVR